VFLVQRLLSSESQFIIIKIPVMTANGVARETKWFHYWAAELKINSAVTVGCVLGM
jgi:hypothetical protein